MLNLDEQHAMSVLLSYLTCSCLICDLKVFCQYTYFPMIFECKCTYKLGTWCIFLCTMYIYVFVRSLVAAVECHTQSSQEADRHGDGCDWQHLSLVHLFALCRETKHRKIIIWTTHCLWSNVIDHGHICQHVFERWRGRWRKMWGFVHLCQGV